MGCQAERQHLIQLAERWRSQGKGAISIIEGEAGIGKSQLLANFLEWGEHQNFPFVIGAGDAIEKFTPYFAWRPIFTQLLKLDHCPDDQTRRQQLIDHLGNQADLAPLLNIVLGLEFPETELTQQIQGQVRADNTRNLLLHLLRAHQPAKATPPIIVLEDAHWLDSGSWSLLLALSQKSSGLLCIIATRPLPEPWPLDFIQTLEAETTHHLPLTGLSRPETQAFISRQLAVTTLPTAVVDFVYHKAEGHPLFSEELAYSLRDTGLIEITGQTCQIATDNLPFEALDLPNTLQGLITSRIDRLLPTQQLILKVASVIGRNFRVNLLEDIYPLEADKAQISDLLVALDHLDLLTLEIPEGNLGYMFRHIMTQEVAYQLLVYSQRRELHQAISQWYEQTYADELRPYYGLLAYHWEQAEQVDPAFHYLKKAGEQALLEGTYQEATAFFEQAVTLSTATLSLSRLERGILHRHLGEAYFGCGKLPESQEQLQKAIGILQAPIPEAHFWLGFKLVGQGLRQFWHQVWPQRPSLASRVQAIRLELTRSHLALGEVCYYTGAKNLGTYATIAGLNLAETVPPSPELARIYANMCYATGVYQLHFLARRYGQLAERTLEAIPRSLASIGWICMVTGVYKSGLGDWQDARQTLEASIAACRQRQDQHLLAQGIAGIALVEHCQGRFLEAITLWQETQALGEEYTDLQAQAWGLIGQGEALVCLGHWTELEPLVGAAQTLLEGQLGLVSDQIRLAGIASQYYLHQGQFALAQQAVAAALTQVTGSQPIALCAYEGYASLLKACLDLWRIRESLAPSSKHHRQSSREYQAVRRAFTALEQFAKSFPIARPRLLCGQGVWAWQQGRLTQANQLWQQGHKLAKSLAMPYDKP
ncbi:MAG: AAA family ATPase [Acaryochloridaceae cyanobacterium SU_2_1]|nr:AAA family ATPase [Acaryochloridaceae cyanobacterium SU_2_1]